MVTNCRNKFLGLPPGKNGVQKLWTYFRRLHNSKTSANISGVKRDRDNRETALKTTEFGPLMAKIGPSFSPTLRNQHLLGGAGHHVGLPLGVSRFLVSSAL